MIVALAGGGFALEEIRRMPLSTAQLLAQALQAREAEAQAAMLLAVNVGSQGGRADVKKAVERLTHAG